MHREAQSSYNQSVLFRADSVADRSAGAEHVIGSEVVRVVFDVVITNFRTHEDMSPEVVADASAGINQKVIGTDIVGATEIAAVVVGGIEARTLPANTTE